MKRRHLPPPVEDEELRVEESAIEGVKQRVHEADGRAAILAALAESMLQRSLNVRGRPA